MNVINLVIEDSMNYYDILEVSPKASVEVIEKAYRVLVKKYHPDMQPADKKAWAEEKVKELNMAYETLSDEGKRAFYDEANGIDGISKKRNIEDKLDMDDSTKKDIIVESFISWFRSQK